MSYAIKPRNWEVGEVLAGAIMPDLDAAKEFVRIALGVPRSLVKFDWSAKTKGYIVTVMNEPVADVLVGG